MEVYFKKLTDTAITPTRGSEKAAGWDLYADANAFIPAGETVKIPTGLAIAPPDGYFGAIFARSGLGTRGVRPANCVGVCDEDYRGGYIVALHNDSNIEWEIRMGDRIAQLVFLPYLNINFKEVEELDDTERGAGGFGSTGK